MKRARKNGNEKKVVLEPTHVIVTVLDGCYNEAPDFYYRALSEADSDFNIKTVSLLNESTPSSRNDWSEKVRISFGLSMSDDDSTEWTGWTHLKTFAAFTQFSLDYHCMLVSAYGNE